jgi:tetratricopeptide (TPR) repeat protein
MAKRLPYLFVGWFWYVITLLPVIGIVQIGEFVMADRYHYVPSIGIGIMLAWGIPSLIKVKNMRKKILFPAGLGFITVLSFIAWHQCGYWKNTIELSKHSLQLTKNNYKVHACLALALASQGKIQEAIYHYNEAILINPNFVNAYYLRGNAYNNLGQYKLAIDDYNKAIQLELDPHVIYFIDIASVYLNMGGAYFNLGDYQQAVNKYNEAIRWKYDYAEAYNNRGISYAKLGQYQHSFEDFNKAISFKQGYADAYNNRAILYFK